MAAPKLQIYTALDGSLHVGYERADLPLIHEVVSVAPGKTFRVDQHWPCGVCTAHGFTADDFNKQWPDALKYFGRTSLH